MHQSHVRGYQRLPAWAWLAVVGIVTVVIALGGRGTQPARAADNINFTFSQANYTVSEASGPAPIVVMRLADAGNLAHNLLLTVTDGTAVRNVHYSTGFDPQAAVFAGAGTSSTPVSFVSVINNATVGPPSRTFTITLTAIDGVPPGMPPSATITINDDDGPVAPVVTSVSPGDGPTAGGTSVSINGTGFTGTTGPGGVTFGGLAAMSYIVNSNILITATVPAHVAGTVAVVVTNNAIASNSDRTFTYTDGPRITSISPTTGSAGTTITITGTGFKGVGGGSNPTVAVGAANAAISGTPTATTITIAAPVNTPGTYNVIVTVDTFSSTNTAADDFTYLGAPVITSLSPTSGNPGVTVTVNGSFFQGISGSSIPTVTFDGLNAAIVTLGPALMTVTAPNHVPGLVNVQVTVDSIQSSTAGTANDFTYTGAPQVTNVSPTGGPPGITVTITGSGFAGGATVSFGGVAAQITSITPTQILAVAPDHTTGLVDIRVTVAGQTSAIVPEDHFTYTTSGVAITGIDPTTGPTAGGTVVTLSGVGFSANMTATFGGTAVTVTYFSAVSAQVISPPRGGPGAVSIRVTATSGASPDTDADNFTYLSVPVVRGVSPASGSATGITSVSVTGFNFTGATSVKFGAANAANFTINSDTSITVATPNNPPVGTVDVIVTNSSGSSAPSSASLFTFTGTGGAPTITGLSPNSTTVNTSGTVVTISGTNFTADASVTFGAQQGTSVQVLSSTQLKVTAPSSATAGTVEVVITTSSGANTTAGSANDFTYGNAALPTVTGLSPNNTPINTSGTFVTITGTNFLVGATVAFGGVAATNVTFVSSTQLTATAPARTSAATVDVIVTTTDGSSSGDGSGNDFSYTDSSLTFTYQLFRGFTLITWTGKDNMGVEAALKGIESPDNPNTVSVFTKVTAVFYRSQDGTGCSSGVLECWLGFFPNGVGVPGANNLALLRRGFAYWVAANVNTPWVVVQGP